MKRKLINIFFLILILFTGLNFVSAANETNTSELVNEILLTQASFNQKNYMWGGFLIVMFFFWWFILAHIPKYEISRENYVKSITLIVLHFICWAWIIYIFWLFGSALFVSRSEEFLANKLYIIAIGKIISLVLLGLIGILNMMKYGYKISNAKELYEELVYEVKNGDD